MSATLTSGTAPPRPGTGSRRRRSMSPRALSLRRTRIGACQSGRLSFARPMSTSPLVAKRTAVEIASVVTPSSAARSGCGRMTISGCSRLALEVTLPSPGMVARSRASASAARPSWPEWSPPGSPAAQPVWAWVVMRTPGM